MADCINALKEWTGKANVTIVFDSTFDEFTDDGLFDKVKGKPNIAIVGFTTDGDVFGGFYSPAVTKQFKDFFDPNLFAFSFESHGRCETPKRFMVKEGWLKEKANVSFSKNNISGFVGFWVFAYGWFYLGNEKSNSWCHDLSDAFEGIEKMTLTGQNNTSKYTPPFHHCARIVAIQLE